MGRIALPRSTTANDAPQDTTKPSSLACLECRRKHLKCDGIMPTCGRCVQTDVQCQYTPSRRGYKHGLKGPSVVAGSLPMSDANAVPVTTAMPVAVNFPLRPADDYSATISSGSPSFGSSRNAPPQTCPPQLSEQSVVATVGPDPSLDPGVEYVPTTSAAPQPYPQPPDGDDYLLDFYYAFFHESHPILPPANLLRRLGRIPSCLDAVLKFIGSHYAPKTRADVYRGPAASLVSMATEPTFYRVQALLFFSIALHARSERSAAAEYFARAVSLALKLGMNRASFSELEAGKENSDEVVSVRLETIRRTWWELYIVDSQLSAFDQLPLRIDNDTEIDVPLPCDDTNYAAGTHLCGPFSAAQFYNRVFCDDEETGEIHYSSYSHVIEATHVLRRVLSLHQASNDQLTEHVESIDARIGSWFRHLPERETLIVRSDGSVDQNLFRAHMLMHCAEIYLHFPRSGLLYPFSSACATISCVLSGTGFPPASTTHLVHTTKAVKAANGMASLATLRSSVAMHTPFFICALVLGAVVQLCACSPRSTAVVEGRTDRIALIIGELKDLYRTWTIAGRVMQQIKGVAREVLELSRHGRPHLGLIDSPVPNITADISAFVTSDAWLGDITTS